MSDIPGNRPIDAWREAKMGEIDQGLRQATKAQLLLDPEKDKDFTQALVAFLEDNSYSRMIERVEDEIRLEAAQDNVDDLLFHGRSAPEGGIDTPEAFVDHHWDEALGYSTESFEHLRRDMLYDELPERLHDKVYDPDWYQDHPTACPDCGNPKFGGKLCQEREADVVDLKGGTALVEDDHGKSHRLSKRRQTPTGYVPDEGDTVTIKYKTAAGLSRWVVTDKGI